MFWSDRKLEWTGEHRRTLQALTVDEDGPGTVLRDFQMLLAFVAERELPVSKTYQLPPLQVLPEINACLAHPIKLGLKRPQLKSYPHVQGLYLLLRASGLAGIRATPARPVLTIDAAAYASWNSLNPAERYFTLLETWLLRGQPEIVGEEGSFSRFLGRYFQDCFALIDSALGDGLPMAGNDRAAGYLRYSPGLHGIALLELFGLLSVKHGPAVEGQGWQVEHATTTPLGAAIFALLSKEVFSDFDRITALQDTEAESFGVLQPVFHPYVPAWRNNLSLTKWRFREGIHVFSVSLGRGMWRRIAVPGGLTLDTLAETILKAFQFDNDHLYEFSYRNRFGVETVINHPFTDDRPWTSEVLVGDVPLEEGQSMIYLFDFGDRWEFDVLLEGVVPPDGATVGPKILDGHGKAPEQYPSWD